MLRPLIVVGAVVVCAASASQTPQQQPQPPQPPAYDPPVSQAPGASPNDDCPSDLMTADGGCKTPRRGGPDHCDVTTECEQLCERGDAKACTEMGFAHMKGRKVGLDRRRAAQLFEKACAGGDHWGCYNQGALIIARDRVPYVDLQVAIGLLDQACAREPKLCTNRAVMFRDGLHSRVDKARAAELFSRACIGGDGSACHDLALAYDSGSGVGKDVPRATELEIESCRLGFAHGCAVAGAKYLYGTGVVKDQREAARYVRLACSRGNQWGCGMVGLLIWDGVGGERRDPAAGRRQMEDACSRGSNHSCALLGLALRTKGDHAGARPWLKRACDGGLREYCN